MNWHRLTHERGHVVMVNFNQVISVTPAEDGSRGSVLLTTSFLKEGGARTIKVKETQEQIARAIFGPTQEKL